MVSGDYYRVFRWKDVLVLIVADCTGHGVPGAMMSFLAHSFFHSVALEDFPSDPSGLLFRADEFLFRALNSFHTDVCMDGMDVSEAAYVYLKEKRISYAGASRFAILMHENEPVFLGGSKFSIGYNGFTKDFFSVGQFYQKGDMLYLFSDG